MANEPIESADARRELRLREALVDAGFDDDVVDEVGLIIATIRAVDEGEPAAANETERRYSPAEAAAKMLDDRRERRRLLGLPPLAAADDSALGIQLSAVE